MSRDKLTTLSNAANRAFYDRNFQKALKLYTEAIQLDPTNFILFSNRSAIFLRLKYFRESLDDAKQSIALNSKWAKGYFRKGDALCGFGKFDEAIFAYCQSLTIENEIETINALKDSLYYSSIKDHLSILLNEIGNDTNDVKLNSFLIISIIGQEYLSIGHLCEAIELLQLALDMDEANIVSLDLKLSVIGAISFAYYQQKNYQQTIKYLEMQLEITKQLGELEKQLTIYSSIVRITLLNDETILAINYLRKQIELMHSNGIEANDLQLNLADLHIQIGEYQHAAQIIASIRPLTFQCILEIVKLALVKNDSEAALAYCNRLAKISNTVDEKNLATILKCKCLLLRKETGMALNILQNTMTHFENDETTTEIIGQYFGILSECHLALGQYCMARKWAKKELKIATNIGSLKLEADSLKNLSNIYQAIGDYSNAVILWDRYCNMISDQGIDIRLSSLRRLAELYQKSNRFDEAEMALLENLKLAQKIGAYTLIIDIHTNLYQFYREMHRKDEARKHWNEAQQIYLDHKVNERQALIIEMNGDNYFDDNFYEEAIDAYNRCLMLVQEDDNLQKEAKLCNKLGTTHWLLYHPDEALAYYQQSLSVCQQISDLESMLELYNAMANIHFKKGMMDECHSCLRCYLTLADILSKDAARLDALIFIGRTLLLRQRYKEAKKIFIKTLNLTSETNNRRERGLIYGYMAECYLGMNDKSKALLNFCKQIPFFDDIDDIEGKCETLRHLIEEKRLINDANWTMRLCRNRIELSQMGPIDLQVEVLKESAEIAASLSELWEACKFLEKAVTLCIANKCSNILNLLLNLKNKYLKCNAQKRAIKLFRECLDAVGIHSYEQVSILLELGKMELEEGLTSNAIAHIMNVKKKCHDKNLKAKCEYILACAFYDDRNYTDALYHMQNFENLQKNLSADQKEKLKLELLLIEWHCNASDYAIETIQDIAMKTDSLIIHRILDESCLYDLLNHEKLSKIAAIHWMMTRGDFITAKHFFDLHKNFYRNSAEYTADMALFYWNEQKFEECSKFLDEYLSYYFEKNTIEEECEELSLIRFYSRQRIILDFLYVIWILCKCMLNANAVETVTVVEIKFWRNIQNRKLFIEYSIPTIQTTRECIQNLKKNLLYCLHVDRYKLIWYFKVGQIGKLYYFIDSAVANKMPKFFTQFLDQMLCTVSTISVLNNDEFEKLISESEFLVNVKHVGDIKKTHLIALNEPKYTKNRKEPEIGILYAGVNSATISWEFVRPNDRIDFICKTKVSSLVIIDFTKMPIDVDINSFSNNDVVILLNNETDDVIINFRIANAHCLLDIKQQSIELLMPFFEKLINGHSVEECSELLQSINVRLFGDRSSKVRSSLAQCTRKMIANIEDGLLENLAIGENEQREIDNFKRLPSKIQFYLLDMIKHQVKTNEIQLFVEKLEDICGHNKDITLPNYCDTTDDYLQELFVQKTHDEQNFILKFIKNLFRDHLYGVYDEVQTSKLDNLEELMKSLANNVRVTRKKQRRKLRTRGHHSEGESSRRSSISENTDSEAVVVDVEFQESE